MMPPPLPPGSTVALLAMSSPAREERDVPAACALLESWGYRVRPGASLGWIDDYLAGTPEDRARELADTLADPAVDGVLFLRGGSGAGQLLARFDTRALARGKCLGGYSDLTALLNTLAMHGGSAWHLPTTAALATPEKATPATVDAARRALAGELAGGYSLRRLTGGFAAERPVPGNARGRLLGGNLTVFTTLLGTRHLPDPEGAILFLEDINEPPYRIDRMLTHLGNAGYLDRLAGFAFGGFTACDPPKPGGRTALEAALYALRGRPLPVIAGLPAGHDATSFPLPIGAVAEIDGDDLLLA
ncbi:MAG: LD-carboxypeptidase [Candidatus Sumerlaeia bacterium]|nr:LD-carboxypeptidase [Candidatus Sumerlaeia bacterium]